MTRENFKRKEDFIIFSEAVSNGSGHPFICERFAIKQRKELTARSKVFVKGLREALKCRKKYNKGFHKSN